MSNSQDVCSAVWGSWATGHQTTNTCVPLLGACLGGFTGHPPGPHPFRPQGFRISNQLHQIPDSLDSTAPFHPCNEGETPQTLLKHSGKNGGCWGERGEQFPQRVGLHLGTVCSTPTYIGGLWQVQLTMTVTKNICLDGGLGGSKTINFAQESGRKLWLNHLHSSNAKVWALEL